jgi:hypothetical protein
LDYIKQQDLNVLVIDVSERDFVKYQSITFLILDAIQQSCKTITAFF